MKKPIKVPFHGTTLVVVDVDGEPYTPLKPIAEGMGLDWKAQYRRVVQGDGHKGHTLNRWGIRVTRIPSKGGKQESACIPLRKLAGWLMTLHPARVKPELRDKIITYQNECDDALWKYWNEGAARRSEKPAAPPPAAALPPPPALSSETVARINRHAWTLAQGAYERYRAQMQADIERRLHFGEVEQWVPLEATAAALRALEAAAIALDQSAKNARASARRAAGACGVDYERDVVAHFYRAGIPETLQTPAEAKAARDRKIREAIASGAPAAEVAARAGVSRATAYRA